MKEVPLSEVKDDLSRFLREAETREIVFTGHGKAAGVLIGLESEDDWFDYRLENDPRFLRRIEQARNSLRAGRPWRARPLAAPNALEELDTKTASRRASFLRPGCRGSTALTRFRQLSVGMPGG
jgi:prevent-host-death family protein